jgi:hypothetical protein
LGLFTPRWRQFVDDAGLFRDRWGQEAERLGFSDRKELFGLPRTAPMARYDNMGMLGVLRGKRVTELIDGLARLTDRLERMALGRLLAPP